MPARDGNPPGMKMMRKNLYAMLGMAAWKYGMPYAKKKLRSRRTARPVA
jgi:hypothetical protein